MFPAGRGHTLTGPVEVTGAAPGQVLAVRLIALRPAAWGWTVAAARDNRLTRRARAAQRPPSWLLWAIDADAGTATCDRGYQVPIAPFLGVLGMPPDEAGTHSTVPPRAARSGDIDCRELTAGSVLYLPVTVPGRCSAWATGMPPRATAKWPGPRSNAR